MLGSGCVSLEMPQKRRTQAWTELKQAGNQCFRAGQYGEAVSLYSQAINALEKSGKISLMEPHQEDSQKGGYT